MGCIPSKSLKKSNTSISASSFLIRENKKDPFSVYEKCNCLGEGSYGKVFKVRHKSTGEFKAMKIINKSAVSISKENELELIKEITILSKLDHPNIIKIHEYFNLEKKLFIVSELCLGGELFDKITKVSYFSEQISALIMKQLLSAIYFCHENNIIHRDLKPENILLENDDDGVFQIKLIDFGTSVINDNKMIYDKIGTAYYIAPEVLNKKYNEKCDLWSCGVILYILLSGKPPFGGETDEKIMEKIKIGKFTIVGEIWDEISIEAKHLIENLLNKDISQRLSAKEAIQHKWFELMASGNNNKFIENESHMKILPNVIKNIKAFRAEKKLQQASLAYIVHNLVKKEDVNELRKIFLDFDLNGDGRLTKDELLQGLCKTMLKTEAIDEVDRIMDNMDLDKNGYIEYEEFLRASLDKEKVLSKENLKIAFDMFDEDKTGFITYDSIIKILGQQDKIEEEVWSKVISEFDSNGDGKLSIEEFEEMMSKLVNYSK